MLSSLKFDLMKVSYSILVLLVFDATGLYLMLIIYTATKVKHHPNIILETFFI